MTQTLNAPASDAHADRIDAEVLTEYIERLQAISLSDRSRTAREQAGPDAPIEVFARHLINGISIDAADDGYEDKAGSTDVEEIARWHRRLADALCIPTHETTKVCARLEPDTNPATDSGLRRWNAHFQLTLRDAGVYVRRGRHDGPHSYELCMTGYGWTLVDHGEPASDRERTDHLIEQSAKALVRAAKSMGGATKNAETVRAELWEDADREARNYRKPQQ